MRISGYNIGYPAETFTYRDLCFRRLLIAQSSSRGAEYLKRVDVGMPKIPRRALDCTFYLYKSREDAEKGVNFGGTGFLVCVDSEQYPDDIFYMYGVTNWHVVLKDGYSVIRINTVD